MDSNKKQQRYQRMYKQLADLLAITDNVISQMATAVAVLHHKTNASSWTGFYQLVDGELTVGPYQGLLACQKLEKDAGVCWAAVNQKKTILVDDVNKFPGHIACDQKSKSEIVVPCMNGAGEVFAVLDIDSYSYNSFDQNDAEGLEKIAKLINP